MARQLIINRGFENGLTNYVTQGMVSINNDAAYSGIKSAQMLSSPTSIAELSQIIFLVLPGTQVRFSFYSRSFLSEDVKSIANIRAEVNFLSAIGTTLPPGIVINIRGRDVIENIWNCYDGYAEAPPGTLAVQILIRLEPPESGTSGLLVDDLALVAEVVTPAPPPVPV